MNMLRHTIMMNQIYYSAYFCYEYIQIMKMAFFPDRSFLISPCRSTGKGDCTNGLMLTTVTPVFGLWLSQNLVCLRALFHPKHKVGWLSNTPALQHTDHLYFEDYILQKLNMMVSRELIFGDIWSIHYCNAWLRSIHIDDMTTNHQGFSQAFIPFVIQFVFINLKILRVHYLSGNRIWKNGASIGLLVTLVYLSLCHCKE